MITGTTKVAAVIGSPIRHSLSPALHNAAFQQLGVDWVYAAFDVAPGRAQAAVDAVRWLGIRGLSVTTPHKEAIAGLVDSLDPAAAALRSVNTVVPQADGSLKGYSTDGAGFVASLFAAGVEVQGRTVCVLGAGAAARSIIDALGRSGVARIVVVNRTHSAAEEALLLAGSLGALGSSADVGEADIVVNATSLGMGGAGLPCDAELLRADQIVADIVYHPRDTAFLRAARGVGAVVVDGLGMLVQQAALQQHLWHGLTPDVSVMAAAAERELAGRRQ